MYGGISAGFFKAELHAEYMHRQVEIPEFCWRGWVGRRECRKKTQTLGETESVWFCSTRAPVAQEILRVELHIFAFGRFNAFLDLKAIFKHFHDLQSSWSDTEDTEK